ncbi:MAG: NnrU family protein [Pirellulaceae bacterium]
MPSKTIPSVAGKPTANPIFHNVRSVVYRVVGLAYGFGNQLLFLVTVWYLFWFMRDGAIITCVVQNDAFTLNEANHLISDHATYNTAHGNWIVCDCFLAILFAVSHSAMLLPPIRKYLSQWIPAPFYDTTFCMVTCISLLLLFFHWRTSEFAIWHVSGSLHSVVRGCFYLSWGALIYSLALTGLGYQNGWTPFYYWMRGKKGPRREFKPRGAYKLIRHPVYLSFLGLVWFTPRMTLDHLALTLIWTAYIFYGSFLKDRRLEKYIGEPYRQYETRVAGYPLIMHGPLAKRRTTDRCGESDDASQSRSVA